MGGGVRRGEDEWRGGAEPRWASLGEYDGLTGLSERVGLALGSGGKLGGCEGRTGRIERVSGKAPYYAYAVINDQANSDGSFIPPVTEEQLAGRVGLASSGQSRQL